MKSKKEIEEYLGMKIEPYYIREVESIYGEEQVAYDRYVLGQRIPANYSERKALPKNAEDALKKLIKESIENNDMETATTCHSILRDNTSGYREVTSIDGLNKEQIDKLVLYEQEQNEKNKREWEELQARIKAEQEAKEKAEEQARLKAEQEAKEKAEEQARLKAEQEAKQRAEEQARLKAEQEAKEKAEEQARIKAEQEAKQRAEEQARLRAEQEAKQRAEEQARLKAEQEEKERQASIEKDIAEFEQYEELISKKPELDKLFHDLYYEDFSVGVDGRISERMVDLLDDLKKLPENERKIILQRYNGLADLTINEQGQIIKDGVVQELPERKEKEQEGIQVEQIEDEISDDELEEQFAETTSRLDYDKMMEEDLEYMRTHQTYQPSQVVQDYWNRVNSQQAKEYEQQQPEKIRPREESIRDTVGDKKDRQSKMQIQEVKTPTLDLWMNRFDSWYSAIDRVSQNAKAKFVKMKSDIINAISNKIKERMNKREVNTQDQDSSER